MIRPARLAPLLALTLALGLGGCITLFPKEKPDQLYRFEIDPPPATATPMGGPPITVRTGAVEFDQASSGERLLTVEGDQVAYVAGARWDIPASTLFEEGLLHAFNAGEGRVRLLPITQVKADYHLVLQVTRFETRYLSGPAAAPTIVVHLHAGLERQSDQKLIAEKEFDAQAPASDNRVGAIVTAYHQAATQAVDDLVTWVDQTATQ